jgi:hypothetical protein
LAIIYACSMTGNFFAAPAVDFLGARWAMVLGSSMYTLFLAGFLFLNPVYLYASSALLGFGSSLLWTGQGKYLAMNSNTKTSGRNSSLLWALLMTSLLGGRHQ